MKYCTFLHNHINFMPQFIQPCCDVYAYGVPKFSFRGGYVNMEKYAEHIKTVLHNLQENTDEYCKHCQHLTERERERITFR